MKAKLSKKIFIVDCDYLYATSNIPNYKAMKLHSYHSQIGDNPTLIDHEYQLTDKHDTLYLIREQKNTPIPGGGILDDYRTILVGKQFEIFDDVWEMPNEVAVCRPEYSIYKYDKPNIYDRASFVQFINNRSILKNVQDWRRADNRVTVIVDHNLWDATPQIITQALESIRFERNIMFLHPIKLKKLLDSNVMNAFLKLKLAKFYKIRYNNNIGDDYDSVVIAIDIMKRLKKEFPYLNLSSLPVKTFTKDHWENKDNIYYDFERCLKIMTEAQKQKVRINFRYPNIRLASPSWAYFEFFKTWSNHFHTLSYVEALMKGSTNFYRKNYSEILNNERMWNTAKIKQAVHLIGKFPDLMLTYGFTGWGGVFSTSVELIDFEYVKEKGIENHIL